VAAPGLGLRGGVTFSGQGAGGAGSVPGIDTIFR